MTRIGYTSGMTLFIGALCFGLVMGWLTACLAHHSRAGWREFKAALAVLFSAAMQSMFGGLTGLAFYAAGVVVGAALYGVTLRFELLRRAHGLTVQHPARNRPR